MQVGCSVAKHARLLRPDATKQLQIYIKTPIYMPLGIKNMWILAERKAEEIKPAQNTA